MPDKITNTGGDAPDAAENGRVSNVDGAASPPLDTIKGDVAHYPMDPAHRIAVEKRLKRKLDARCSLFVLIYIMVRH